MPQIINIATLPTFDLTGLQLKYCDQENLICYFESTQVFKFDCVYGFLNNRSRVTRINKSESTLIEQIVSATIDAGYQGKLVWKVKLTKRGQKVLSEYEDTGNRELLDLFTDCQQIHLFPSPSGNYYNGTNQTTLEPEITFIFDK
jgi:hypothetical protein